MSPKVAIIVFSPNVPLVGLAEAERAGIAAYGGRPTIFQIPEAHGHMGGRAPNYPVFVADYFRDFDAFLFGIPTNRGNFPPQWNAFWDTTARTWTRGELIGRLAGIFTSTDPSRGLDPNQTASYASAVIAHHGMMFVPLDPRNRAHGGAPSGGAVTIGSHGPTAQELAVAQSQGSSFCDSAARFRR